MYENMELPGMCNWCIEDDISWFVAYSINVLFKYDRRTKVLSAVSAIPTSEMVSFQNPLCVKYENLIYCIPHYQNSIWSYDLNSEQWREIVLCNDKNSTVMASLLGKQNEIYYFFSMALKKIWGLNLRTGNIAASYDIDIQEESDVYYCLGGIMIDGSAYLVFGGTFVYEYNLECRSQKKYELSGIDDTLYRVGYDGTNIWLIGKKKDIYAWNREENTVSILKDFPADFAIYDFAQKVKITDFEKGVQDLFVFNNIYCLGRKVWLIPQAGNKLMYYSVDDGTINTFEIPNEEETEATLDLNYRHIATKFFLMYVREERYLGIYSYKNKRMLEIDTLNMSCENIDILVDEDSLFQMGIQDFYEDGNESTYLMYNAKFGKHETGLTHGVFRCMGEQIFKELIKES